MQDNLINIKEVINSYDKLEISDKRKELGREISEMTIIIEKILNDITNEEIFTSEVLSEFDNLYNTKITESEYLTGLYEDVLNFKELLGICLDKLG